MARVTRRDAFSDRLRDRAQMTGVFQKFPHHQVTEILATSDLDFAVLDTEHAPFDPSEIDACMLASMACDFPLLVRVARPDADALLSVLDMGAAGVFVPHVDTPGKAAAAARLARYAGGGRGFSPSTRAGAYGRRGLRSYMDAADRDVLVIAQIEDAPALKCLPAIAQTPGIDALFIGRADLAASFGCDWDDPKLDEATAQIAQSAADAGIACGAYLADPAQAARFRGLGISFLLAGSDQGALRQDANRLAAAMASE
jgi:2-keto-3-deoxy-L-rhamnonate aldolase RhmA